MYVNSIFVKKLYINSTLHVVYKCCSIVTCLTKNTYMYVIILIVTCKAF